MTLMLMLFDDDADAYDHDVDAADHDDVGMYGEYDDNDVVVACACTG